MKFEIKLKAAIETIEKNLRDHIVELNDASEVWTKDMQKALSDMHDAVTRDGLKASHEKIQQLIFHRPIDNRPQYSKYLGALKRAEEDGQLKITVDEDDYDRIFQDNWEWRIPSKLSNTSYSSRKGG